SSQVSLMSVRLPKKSSSLALEPKVVSSAPMRDSFSMPLISWQPKQPQRRTSVSPFLMFAGSASFCSRPGIGSPLVPSFVVREPQARHACLGRIAARVFDPVINPLRCDLGRNIFEVRHQIFGFPERRGEFAVGKTVAAAAADAVDELLALRHRVGI